eukprot:TRINITY_DN14609_c0_g1_i2.p1 TRINITY_DN14609_c0_g1~~TRINITY_DN14609_c0_g1_i2.p1  ORF type:complete len:518 (+),score=124.13 TRINITY_DN14609_c0_g1_i2:290-1843(+)
MSAEESSLEQQPLAVDEWAKRTSSELERMLTENSAAAEELLRKQLEHVPEIAQAVRPSQLQAVQFALARGGRALIADEMGLGKTLVALLIAACYSEKWPMLVVAPKGVQLNWNTEVEKWLPHLAQYVQALRSGKDKVDPEKMIVLTTYDQLRSSAAFRQRHDGKHYKVVIVDEAHYLKTPTTARTSAILPMCRAAEHCILLSGTPVLNNAAELWSLFQAVSTHQVDFEDFVQKYCNVYEGREGQVMYKGVRHHQELHRLLNAIMVRHMKKEVLRSASGKNYLLHDVDVSEENRKKVSRQMRAMRFTGNVTAQHLKVWLFGQAAKYKRAAVTDYVMKLLSSGDDDCQKLVVFAHHRAVMDGIEAALKEEAMGYIRIDGDVKGPLRKARASQFQEEADVRVALLSLTAMGHGVSFTAATTMVMAELHWVPGRLLQAEDRIYRPRQDGTMPEEVTIHYCVVKGEPFIDEDMFQLLETKLDTVNKIVTEPLKQAAAENTFKAIRREAASKKSSSAQRGKGG